MLCESLCNPSCRELRSAVKQGTLSDCEFEQQAELVPQKEGISPANHSGTVLGFFSGSRDENQPPVLGWLLVVGLAGAGLLSNGLRKLTVLSQVLLVPRVMLWTIEGLLLRLEDFFLG